MSANESGSPEASQRLRHYVLFGPPKDPATQVHLLLAQDYLIAARANFGFSADEAALAQHVTIIADTSAVDEATEQKLISAGSRVERVQGSVDEVARTLSQLAGGGRGS